MLQLPLDILILARVLLSSCQELAIKPWTGIPSSGVGHAAIADWMDRQILLGGIAHISQSVEDHPTDGSDDEQPIVARGALDQDPPADRSDNEQRIVARGIVDQGLAVLIHPGHYWDRGLNLFADGNRGEAHMRHMRLMRSVHKQTRTGEQAAEARGSTLCRCISEPPMCG